VFIDSIRLNTDIFEKDNQRLIRYCRFFNLVAQVHFIISYFEFFFLRFHYAELLVCSFFLLFINYIFLSKQRLFLAQVFLFLIVNFNLSWFTVTLGKESGVYLLYIPTFAFYISMIDFKRLKKYLIIGLVGFITSLYAIFHSFFMQFN